MAIRTVFTMVEDCRRGERQGWYDFVRDYAGIAGKLLQHYFPTLTAELDAHMAAVFRRAQADSAGWFSGLRFSNEREFLMALRDLVFAYGREVARVPTPQLSLDQLRQIMADLPLVEREMLWLIIKGYTAEQIAPIMMNAAATVQAVKKVGDERLAAVVPGAAPDVFVISARVLMEQAETARTEQCSSLKTFNDIVNGQITWRERELAEEHVQNCFYCIDRFTTFLELLRLRRDVSPLPEPEVEKILAELNLPAAKSKGLFARLLSRP
jgi:hypothetical protein